MNAERAKVSIIIPLGNVASHLLATLNSAMNQTLEEIEIICVDDGSEDGSRAILDQCAEQDRRIKAIYHTSNMSASQARKDGVGISSGQYVMFLDGDDELEPDACEKAFEAIEQAGTDMVQFGTRVVNDTGDPSADMSGLEKWNAPHTGLLEGDLIDQCFVQRKFPFNLWNKIYKGDRCRRAFELVEDGYFPCANDSYAFFLIASMADSYYGIDPKLYIYHHGRELYGQEDLSLAQYDLFLSQKKVYEALKRVFTERKDDARLSVVEDVLKPHFAEECAEKWLTLICPADAEEAYAHLVKTWGFEEVICALAKKHWEDRCLIASKMAEIKAYSHPAVAPQGRKRTIALYYRKIANGGAERVTAQLAGLLSKVIDNEGAAQYRIILITDEPILENEYPVDGPVLRCLIPAWASSQKGNYRQRYQEWERIIDEYDIDIVVSGEWFNPYTLWDMLSVKGNEKRPAFIMHVHNFTMRPFQWETDYGQAITDFYRLCDGVVTLSETDQTFVSFYNHNVHCIPNPLDYLAQNDVSEKRENHTILWTGRLTEVKQPRDLLRMMHRVVAEVPDAKLYLVGTGEERYVQELKREAERLVPHGQVVFTGFTEDVSDYLQLASVYVCTSKYEGFGLSVGEALSYSIPIVMYDMPWLTFVKDGRGITTVPMNRYDELAREVIALLKDPEQARSIGCVGREQITKYAQIDIAAEWGRVFDGIDFERLPLKNNTDEGILFRYLSLYQEQGKNNLRQKSIGFENINTLRIDIKNIGMQENDFAVQDISDQKFTVSEAPWLTDETGHGYMIKASNNESGKNFTCRIVCRGNGQLQVALRGMNVPDKDGKRVPFWMDVLEFNVDNMQVLSGPVCVWHDKPYRFEMSVVDGQEVDVEIVFKPHGVGELIAGPREMEGLKADRQFLANMLDVRMELKNLGVASNDIEIVDTVGTNVYTEEASWLTNDKGHGYNIRATSDRSTPHGPEGTLAVRCRCIGNGKLQIILRGMNVPGENGKRIPYWMDVLSFRLNGSELLVNPVCVWHDKPWKYEMQVKDGQSVEIEVTFKPHGTGKRLFVEEAEIKRLNAEKTLLTQQMYKLDKKLSDIRSSRSYRLGRAFTAPARKVKKLLRG